MRSTSLGLLAAGLVACAAVVSSPAGAAEPLSPGLGESPTAAELAARDMDIAIDGEGLPPGRGTAIDGGDIYVEKCAACHGLRGQGGPAPALAGGIGSLATPKPQKTVGSYWPHATTLFDYVRRAMPYDRPMSLSADETYALSAFVLWLNRIIGPRDEMNATTLPAVRMPNRDGFVDASARRGRE
jgi:cytochrome c